MSTRTLLSILFVIACQASPVFAGDAAPAPSGDCNPFPPGSLSRWGYPDQPTGNVSGSKMRKDQLEGAPTDVSSEICTIFRTPGKRDAFVWIQAARFGDDADEAAIKQWVETKSEKIDADMKVETSRIGDVTCERGNYVLDPTAPTSSTQLYVACDSLLGREHFAINVQQAATADGLPAPADVEALLKSVIAKLQDRHRSH